MGLQQFKYDCRLSNFYYYINNFALKGGACLDLDRAVAVLSSHASLLTHSPFQKCIFHPHVSTPDVKETFLPVVGDNPSSPCGHLPWSWGDQ